MRHSVQCVRFATMMVIMCGAGRSDAGPGPQFTLEAIGTLGFGETVYEISASGYGESMRSRLEFPLDGIYAGADGRLATTAQFFGMKNISGGLRFLTNITDPSEDMNDYDWVNGRLVGDTVSDTESAAIVVDCSLKGDFVSRHDMIVRGILGFCHEDYAFDVYGIEGYYLPPIGFGPVSVSPDTLTLTYEMTHDWVYGGVEGVIVMNDSLSAEGRAVFGLGLIEDRDDHILRGKVSTGAFVSATLKASAHMLWYLQPPTAAARFYLKAGMEGTVMAAEGEQDQKFEDGHAGYAAIDDTIEMVCFTGNAMVGCTF